MPFTVPAGRDKTGCSGGAGACAASAPLFLMTPKEKRDRIDLGLALLAARAKRGEQFSVDEMAAWCDCNPNTILNIQAKAMAKVRRGLKRQGIHRMPL